MCSVHVTLVLSRVPPCLRNSSSCIGIVFPMAWGHLPSLLSSAVTLILLATFYTSSTQSPQLLSPQGCRMSRMWPSYILQPNFNSSWTRLSRRYSLWLYREADRESYEQARSTTLSLSNTDTVKHSLWVSPYCLFLAMLGPPVKFAQLLHLHLINIIPSHLYHAQNFSLLA